MTHAKAMAITVAYDIYKEVCEGLLDPSYKIDKPVTFFRFREKLAKQMLHYSPKHKRYSGDDKFRCSTQVPVAKRRSPSPRRSLTLNGSSSEDTSTLGTTTSCATRDEIESQSSRLCGDLSMFEKHERSMVQFKSYRSCVICGHSCYWKCMKCPDQPVMHRNLCKGSTDNVSCHVKYHNTLRYGITRAESTKRKWKEPAPETVKAHSKAMKKVCDSIAIANATILPSST